MIDLEGHPHFQRWEDPVGGAVSWVLSHRLAKAQDCLPGGGGVSRDEDWLWYRAQDPALPYATLAAVSLDPARPRIHAFSDLHLEHQWPALAADGLSIYVPQDGIILEQPVMGDPRPVAALPRELIGGKGRTTQAELTADGTRLVVGGWSGRFWFIAIVELATGRVAAYRDLGERPCVALPAPHEAESILVARAWWQEVGGAPGEEAVLWRMDASLERMEPLRPRIGSRVVQPRHAWWLPDGRLGLVDFGNGLALYDPATDTCQKIRAGVFRHAHCDESGRIWIADHAAPGPEQAVRVTLYDGPRAHAWPLVSHMPQIGIGGGGTVRPHPRIAPKGTWVSYTTSVFWKHDVALAAAVPTAST